MEKEGKNKSQHLGFLSYNILGHSQGVQEIWRLSLIKAEKSVSENLIGEKKNGQIKGMIKGGRFSLTQYKSYPTFVPNFKILGKVVPEKSLTQIFQCITLERWKKGKGGKINLSILGFLSHNALGHSEGVYKLWRLALIGAEKSVTEILIGEKEKRTKGNGKQEEADYLTQYKSYPTFVPNFKIVGAVIAEKSLTKKKVNNTHEQTLLWKRQKLYTPYILRIPGV